MTTSVKLALEQARKERTEGRDREAEAAYLRAAKLARSLGDRLSLAFALRHSSDLARQRGALAEAFSQASEAAALYRESIDRLGLANALRLQALSADDSEQGRACWMEARNLYSALDVIAGVAECDSHLS